MTDPLGKLLVVDDNEMNRDMLSRRLTRRGFAVDTVDDGEACLVAVLQNTYDAVLLDVMMPGLDGFAVLERIRERFSPEALPVLMATARDQSEDVVRALEKGANDYVTKPLDFAVVLARVKTQVSLKRAHEEAARSARFIREVFGRYVSPDVVHAVLDQPGGLTLGGTRREMTLLMADLRGFSLLCEDLEPEQTVRVLNIYLDEMINVLDAHHATVDEIIGDAVFAFFGAPLALAAHREAAVRAAVAMQCAMPRVRERLIESLGFAPLLEMGIALHTGDVVVGNIGSSTRTKYGVVGTAVNATGRIEAVTVGGQILASEDVIHDLAHVERGESQRIEAKGALRPLVVHEVRALVTDEGRLEVPETAVALVACAPRSVRVDTMVQKRRAGTAQDASLLAYDAGHFLVQGLCDLAVGAEVRLRPPDVDDATHDAFAKVKALRDDGTLLRMTAARRGFRAWLGISG